MASVALGLAACSGAPPPEPPAVVLSSPAPCGPGTEGCVETTQVSLDVANAPCIHGARGPRCDGLLARGEEKALSKAIEIAQKGVHVTSYRDVRFLIELSRLQVRRDGDTSDSDGENDAARGLKNAMRAVAVEEASPASRLVLAFALARSFQGSAALRDPATRSLPLELVRAVVQAAPPSTGPVSAATSALAGYVALELGQPEEARKAFEYATQVDAGLATAWMGLGDVARGEQRFEAAEEAYSKAALLLPLDAGARRSILAARRREALDLPAAPATTPAPAGALSLAGTLAPAAPPLPSCPAAPPPPAAALCKGLAALAAASTRESQQDAALLVVSGWSEVLPLCKARDAACGSFVAEALAAAARAFRAVGKPAKAIAAGKMLLQHEDLPVMAAVTPSVTLEVADLYFGLGIFDRAAEMYALHARKKGSMAEAAADRAVTLRAALANVDEATRLAGELATDNRYSNVRRAGWLLLAARLLRAARGPEAAAAWLAPHGASITAAGQAAALAEITAPATDAPENAADACPSALACAVKRLAGEARWSAGAGLATPGR